MDDSTDTLFYDGACPLCNAEMGHLRNLKDSALNLRDIHEMDGISDDEKKDMLTTLCMQRADGSLVRGLDANVAAWQHTRFGFLFKWLRWPFIAPIADSIYRRWANRRYERLYGTGTADKHPISE